MTSPLFAVVILVDRRGRLLLQERDEHAPIEPDQWGLVGGHVDPDEDVESAVHRELEEETGLRLARGELRMWREMPVRHPAYVEGRMHVHTALVDLVDEDIVVGEGPRIVFVEPGDVGGLDLTTAAVAAVPAFLASNTYASMVR